MGKTPKSESEKRIIEIREKIDLLKKGAERFTNKVTVYKFVFFIRDLTALTTSLHLDLLKTLKLVADSNERNLIESMEWEIKKNNCFEKGFFKKVEEDFEVTEKERIARIKDKTR